MKTCPRCSKTYGDELRVCPDDQSPLVLAGSAGRDPMSGRLLDGRYNIIEKIGEGGMGAIYKAVHTEMGRTCAIKLLTHLSPGSEDAVARFKREARMASRIDNAHAVTIYDFGQSDDGTLFLAMEFIDGVPLSRVLARERTLPVSRVVHIASQIAEGLAAAHALEIVHRDLKPDNIMLTRKGQDADYVKVLDFGIAKTVTEDAKDNLTKTGFILGTPVYMSPEQLLGERLDPRSDVYSLAIIVYEMLSGRLPFGGDNPQSIMMRRITSEPLRLRKALPSASDALEHAVMTGLARDPAARTGTVEAFAASLSAALQGGTQVLGGRLTGRIGEGKPALATQEWSSFDTRAEGQVLTSHPEGVPSTSPDHSASGVQNASSAGREVDPEAAAAVNEQVTELSFPPASPVEGSPASAAIKSEPARRSRLMFWVGGAAVLVIAALVYLAVPIGGSDFALVVRGAPPGSEIFVNNVSHGRTGADGSLKVARLLPERSVVRIARGGYADFNATVDGTKGGDQNLDVLMLPMEIDHQGQMVLIPAGEFLMGDDNHLDDEKPRRAVSLPDYYIDKYEVTNAQYKRFCDAERGGQYPETGVEKDYLIKNPSSPAVGILYEDAAAYAKWAGKRLPSEEEWEKAASWDSSKQAKRMWPWGDQPGGASANIGRKSVPKLAAVGTFAGDLSAYGVYDMAGNVGEWVDAFYAPYAGNDGAQPKPDKAFGSRFRLVRGGSMTGSIDHARTSFRGAIELEVAEEKRMFMLVGIRCAIAADDSRIQEILRARNKP